MRLVKKLVELSKLPLSAWSLLTEAFLNLIRARTVISFLPAFRLRQGRIVLNYVGASPQEIAWSICTASRFVPNSTCLVRAVATQKMLARHGRPASLCIGVAKSDKQQFTAHAWVECEGSVVVGGSTNEYSKLLKWSMAK